MSTTNNCIVWRWGPSCYLRVDSAEDSQNFETRILSGTPLYMDPRLLTSRGSGRNCTSHLYDHDIHPSHWAWSRCLQWAGHRDPIRHYGPKRRMLSTGLCRVGTATSRKSVQMIHSARVGMTITRVHRRAFVSVGWSSLSVSVPIDSHAAERNPNRPLNAQVAPADIGRGARYHWRLREIDVKCSDSRGVGGGLLLGRVPRVAARGLHTPHGPAIYGRGIMS